MELYQLRTFKMVAEEGHLTRAAQKLHTSQPAVSAHIKNLEDELGVSLFQRTPKGMVLTEQGKKLKGHADEALSIIENMATQAGNMRGSLQGAVRIGLNSEPDFLRISELFHSLKNRHPELNIHLLQSNSDEVLEKLENNQIDLGFMFGEHQSDKLLTQQLARLKLVIVAPKKYSDRLAKASPQELADFPWIMTPENCPFHTVLETFFQHHQIEPTQIALADQESVIKTMVKKGVGLSLLIEADLHPEDKEMVTIWDKADLRLSLSVATLKRRKAENMIKSVLSTISGIWGNTSTAPVHN